MSQLRIPAILALLVGCSMPPSPSQPAPPRAAPPPPASPPPASAATSTVAPSAPELVEFPSGATKLHGFVHRPSGGGPFPAIVFNHGSEQLPGDKPGQAAFWVPRGFVLFVPHRRGHGRSKDAGPHIGAKLADERALVDELVAQVDDVVAAVHWVAAQPYVDKTKIAVAGCSFGGIESLLVAERDVPIAASVDFAGAAMTWAKTPLLQERMKQAARSARVPMLFIQAENDFDTSPSRLLDAEMKAAGKASKSRIYPPNGTTAEDGHHFCAGGDNPAWGEEVLSFVNGAFARRRSP
jgi:dienelactone hydrolase